MQSAAYLIAAFLAVAVGIAHSLLGERFILIPLSGRDNLPELFGSSNSTMRTLRFAWHLTSIAWWGIAAILVLLAYPQSSVQAVGIAIGITFLLHAIVTLHASRGRHLAWIVFLSIGGLSLIAALS